MFLLIRHVGRIRACFPDDLLRQAGMSRANLSDFLTLTLKSDGTVVSASMGQTSNGTWTRSGNTVDITINGSKRSLTWNGNTLSGSFDGESYVFKK